MNLSDVYSEIETRLKNIPGLNVPPIEAQSITADAVLWSLPEERTYLGAYNGGMEKHEIEMIVCVGKNAARAATQRALEYTDPSGPRSIAAAINSSPATPYESCDEVTVVRSRFDDVIVAATEYLGCVITVEIVGSGG